MTHTLSVIVPIHNEQDNVPYFYGRAKTTLEPLGVDWRIVFVNDASTDGSLDRILELRKQDPRIRVITLSRNFGYHSALVAGLSNSDSDLYAIVDVDCEDPPEMLARFHQAIEKGAATAYGIRSERPEPRWLVFGRWAFYWIQRQIADGPAILWMAEFSMFTRSVRDAILASKTTFPYLRIEMANVSLRMEGVRYRREERCHGTSHYNLPRLAKFAIAGFLSSSTFPLRFIGYLSILMASLFALNTIALRLDLKSAGALAGLYAFAYLLMSVPMISLYVARTYKNVTARPVYFVDPERTFLS
ncbi:MAG: glycosyltransferase family 2 protein [Elusimicrobia bacterium]|nr:glycosyltransferase family 2 protein [Elusimicrobiota bacterium]